jgi:hypothetical protein
MPTAQSLLTGQKYKFCITIQFFGRTEGLAKRVMDRRFAGQQFTTITQRKTTSMQVDVAPRAILNPNEAHSVFECSNKRDLFRFLHAAAFSPVPNTWLKSIRAGDFATWPGLTKDLVRKHSPKEIATVKGHLSQRRKNLRSTTTTVVMPVTELNEPGDATPTPTNIKTHQVFAALVDVGKVYSNLTGRFPIQSSRGHQYILTLYDYDSNTISTEPIKNRTDNEMIRAHTALHQQLLNAGLKPELQIMDNECSNAFRQYLTDQHIALQLVPPIYIGKIQRNEPSKH